MAATKIEWAERVWNPVTGCTPISEGCKNCYAKRMALRLQKIPKTKLKYRNGFKPTFHSNCLVDISPREKPALIFVGSMSDIFHRDFEDFDIGLMFGRMAVCSQHRFMILTKRIGRWLSLSVNIEQGFCIADQWPPPNVAFGVTAENQARLKKRLLELKHCQAAYRYLSLEPLLGPISLPDADQSWHEYIDLVIVGGESGPAARQMKPNWVRDIRDDCIHLDVPFCFKQWGEWAYECGGDNRSAPRRVGKKKAGRLLDGKLYDGKINWKPELNFSHPLVRENGGR